MAEPAAADSSKFLLDWLAENEAACPGCGYNVHRLVVPRCPECGRPLSMRVVSTERLSRAWMVCLLAAAMSAGAGLLILGVVVVEGWPREAGTQGMIFNVTLPFFLASIPTPAVALLLRRTFGRWTVPVQWKVAIGAAATVVMMLALFMSNIPR